MCVCSSEIVDSKSQADFCCVNYKNVGATVGKPAVELRSEMNQIGINNPDTAIIKPEFGMWAVAGEKEKRLVLYCRTTCEFFKL